MKQKPVILLNALIKFYVIPSSGARGGLEGATAPLLWKHLALEEILVLVGANLAK